MFEGFERIVTTSDWITLFFLVILLLISILQLNFQSRFNKLFSLIYSEKYYTDFLKTRPLIFNRFHVIFFFIIIFNISLFFYLIFKEYKMDQMHDDFITYVKILTLTIAYVGLRYFIGILISGILDLSDQHNYFTFLKISNLSLLSILSFPFIILVYYSIGLFHKFLITFSLVALVGFGLFRYFVLIRNEKLGFSNLFYLFLYLCALEIAPIIVVYKLFVD